MQQAARTVAYKHRSFSQVKQLRTCGYQYKLQRIDRTPERPGAANLAGTAVHTATEYIDVRLYADGLEAADAEALKAVALGLASEALDEELAKIEAEGWTAGDCRAYGYRPKQDIAWYRATGIPNSVSAYVDWRLATPELQLVDIPMFGPAIEVPFNYYIGDQLIHGKIDRIFTSPESGGYFPLDIKSGNCPKTNEQLGLYGAALKSALGWDIHWGYYLYSLKRGAAKLTPPLSIAHWTDETLAQIYLPATQLIDLGIFIPAPGDDCQVCSVAEACPFSQAVV